MTVNDLLNPTPAQRLATMQGDLRQMLDDAYDAMNAVEAAEADEDGFDHTAAMNEAVWQFFNDVQAYFGDSRP